MASRNPADTFRSARDVLLHHREDYARAVAGFQWPRLRHFNWALDYFDALAQGNDRLALWIVDDDGGEERFSFQEMSLRSNRVANFLREAGVRRSDCILVMIGNIAALWEVMLAAMKLGAVVSPATALLSTTDLADRIARGCVRHVVAETQHVAKFEGVAAGCTCIAIGAPVPGWLEYGNARQMQPVFVADGPTLAADPLLIYFTSGTTAKPKIVLHTHASYPVGHLSTMYWIGLREGDVHFNISSPGWAKHAWSSFFAPWNAGATVFVHNAARFDARRTLEVVVRCGVTTLCAPPTVWRALILEDLAAYPVRLRELVGAGEPLNPEVIQRVRAAWGLTIRDGYGQTETTCQIGNPPGQAVRVGSMGRPMPGYRIELLDADGATAEEGELAIALEPRPIGLMAGYIDQPERSAELLGGARYRTGDVARRDADGYYWYVGRADDVFKSSDYRLSPFELESALLEHEAVAEAAVVPAPDPLRLAVPKACIVLKPGIAGDAVTALALFRFCRERLAPYQRIRRIEFRELPKTVSGKIRRVELRLQEQRRHQRNQRASGEFREEDFPELARTPTRQVPG